MAQYLDDNVGGITGGYALNDGVDVKVPYSFMGSIFDEDEEQAILRVLRQDSLTAGPQVASFQKEFAQEWGVKHAFATTSCTTAMHVATQALGIGPGDEVIVTPNTFIATSLAIVKEGGIPIFADIDPRTFNIDPAEVAKKVTPKTKAIYVVHFGGQMVDMDPIMEIAREHGLAVLEDCAHAHGSLYKGRKAGTIGDVGCWSFHSLKNMSLGEGGMITTNRDDLVPRIELLRNMNIKSWENQKYYWTPSHFDVVDVDGKWGVNYRMNEFQAAIGRAQLRKLPMLVEKRRHIGQYVNAGLQDIKGVTPVYEDPNRFHSYHLYTLCVEPELLGASRDEFLRCLYFEEGVQGILHYQPTYDFTGVKKYLEERGYGGQFCPIADHYFYRRQMNLPLNPRLTKEDADNIIAGVRNAAEKVRDSGK
ncbi:MAG: DegT/DnrJ/EryC1/StrS family aminotransferase [Anaerolineae bacterium]|nr:DegT/DnrJ/EryC1/StrS family aminotransferase [Anaerolineae bacterium]